MNPRLRLALLAFAAFVISIDFNIVYVALPQIGRALGFTAQSLQWVVSAYAVGFGGLLLLGGRAVDRLGARRMFVLGVGIFGAASLVAGLAAEPGVLVAARVAQGTGGALLFPATLALINTSFAAGPERNRALSLWGVAGSSGAVVGPLAGGVIANYLGWEWVFFVNVPLTMAAGFAAVRLLAPDQPRADRWKGFDVPGALVATAGSTLVVFGLASGPDAGWTSARGVGAMALGALLLGAFLAVERRTPDPLAPPRLLRVRSLAVAMALIFVFMGTVNSMHYLFFVDVQDVLGFSTLAAGLAFLPMSVLSIVGAGKLLPLLLRRWGMRGALFAGVLTAGIGMGAAAAGMSATGSFWALLPGMSLLGLAAGMAYPMVFLASGGDVPGGEQGVASALVSTAQQVGGAVGLAALVAVANAGLDPRAGTADVAAGLRAAAWVAAVLTVAAAFLVLLLKRSRQPAPSEPAAEPVPAHA